jgi:hypothetical protein
MVVLRKGPRDTHEAYHLVKPTAGRFREDFCEEQTELGRALCI